MTGRDGQTCHHAGRAFTCISVGKVYTMKQAKSEHFTFL